MRVTQLRGGTADSGCLIERFPVRYPAHPRLSVLEEDTDS